MSGSGLTRYVSLIGATTNYAKRMTRLRNRIMGEVARPTEQKNLRIVQLLSAQPIQLNKNFVNYYPRHMETGRLMFKLRHYGLFRDEHQDFKEEMKRLRALRGKAPPKKGEGKQALKRKQ